jgi:hypothetical protein
VIMTDIATALDHVLGDPKTESKFQALKVLHAKKIKSLMGSIDTQQKEIGKLKTLSKDNRRTQIIQSLKKKLRDQELVSDVLKEEFEKKLEWSHEEVNDFVIRKTISGPKRFRPLTREELENQIAELEKKSKSKQSSATPAPVQNGMARSKTQLSPANSKRGLSGTGIVDGDSNDPGIILKVTELQENASKLQQDCDRKDGTISQLRQELSRLRAANAQLLAGEEERDIMERQFNDLSMNHDRVVEELEDALQKLAVAQEESFQVRSQAELEQEQQTLELETLREQCEKGLKQNTQLLRRMADLEANRGTSAIATQSATVASTVTSHESEVRIAQLQDKLRSANARISTLESASKGPDPATQATIDSLRDSLREKNEAIRELKRTIAEMSRLSRSSHGGRKGEGGAGGGNFVGDVAEAKGPSADSPGSKGVKQFKGGPSDSTQHQDVVTLADKLIEYELHMLAKTDSQHRVPVDAEMVGVVNTLLMALNVLMNAQLRAKQQNGGIESSVLSTRKLQIFEHQMLMRYDVPGVSVVGADEDDDTLRGEIL